MTVPVQETRFSHTGNGVTVEFAYGCQIQSPSDLVVSIDGVIVTSGFTVSGVGAATGGSVAFTAAPADGVEVLLERIIKLERITDYQQNGDFLARVVNPDFDRLWMALQQFESLLGLQPGAIPRALLLGRNDTNGAGAYRALQNRIQDLADPEGQQDATNKQWVERQVGKWLTDGGGQYVLDLLFAASGASIVGRGVSTVDADLTAVEAKATATESAANRLAASPPMRLARPAFLEQHLTGLFGRGMLTSEAINVVSETSFATTALTGATTLYLGTTSNMSVGSGVTVLHDNGKYDTYFVTAKDGASISISPKLRYACTAGVARIERCWYNRAHPGKFYMRYLAQRIAHSTELEAAMPSQKRVLYTSFASNPNTLEDTLTPFGGVTAVTYYDASNGGDGAGAPIRFGPGRTAYVDGFVAAGQGVSTKLFDTLGLTTAVVKFIFFANATANIYKARVIDETGAVLSTFVIPGGADQNLLREYTFTADIRGANKVAVEVLTETYSAPGYFTIGKIDVFDAPESIGPVIQKRTGTIVCLGDSWFDGDTPTERESICVQLEKELPYATIINAGYGGNNIQNLLDRFDTDVTPYSPDYVAIVIGTNDSYGPLATPFDPNGLKAWMVAYSTLLAKIAALGARAIIVGAPALAQSDADVPGYAEWILSDHAKAYARAFFDGMARQPIIKSGSNTNGSWTKLDDGTLICHATINVVTTAANTYASTPWVFPMKPITAPPAPTTSPANYNTNQVLATGSSGVIADGADIVLLSSSGAVSMPVSCTMIGRWKP